uniref:Uncharacterized protein n=1 Tax=Loa loa TaxID=7209 RepID=A0A1I7VZP0_LOALO
MSGIQCLRSESDSIDSDNRNESIKNLRNADISIEVSSSNEVSNERLEVDQNNQQWFQLQSNNLCGRNKSTRVVSKLICQDNLSFITPQKTSAFKE